MLNLGTNGERGRCVAVRDGHQDMRLAAVGRLLFQSLRFCPDVEALLLDPKRLRSDRFSSGSKKKSSESQTAMTWPGAA